MKSKEGDAGSRRVSRMPWLTLLVIAATVTGYCWRVGASACCTWLAGAGWFQTGSRLFFPTSLSQLVIHGAALLIIGVTLERCMARWQWLLLYGGGGGFSALVASHWHDHLFVLFHDTTTLSTLYLGVGASGAVMSLGTGLMGILFWGDLLDAATARRIFDNRCTMKLFKVSGVLLAVLPLSGLYETHADYSGCVAGGVFGLLIGAALLVPCCSATRGVKWAGMLLPVIALAIASLLIVGVSRAHGASGFVRIHPVDNDVPKVLARKK